METLTDIKHDKGQFFIDGKPVSTSDVYREIVRLIQVNAELRKLNQSLINEADDGEEM